MEPISILSMEKQEKNCLRSQLLRARDTNDVPYLTETMLYLLSSTPIEWYSLECNIIFRDLVCLVLSFIPKLKNAKPLFLKCMEEFNSIQSIPEAAYTCILTNYSFYRKPKEALLWLERMKANEIPIK